MRKAVSSHNSGLTQLLRAQPRAWLTLSVVGKDSVADPLGLAATYTRIQPLHPCIRAVHYPPRLHLPGHSLAPAILGATAGTVHFHNVHNRTYFYFRLKLLRQEFIPAKEGIVNWDIKLFTFFFLEWSKVIGNQGLFFCFCFSFWSVVCLIMEKPKLKHPGVFLSVVISSASPAFTHFIRH